VKIGEKLRKLRDLHSYDQKYLADSIGVSVSQYCKYEKNETPVSLETVEKIAVVYKITTVELLSWDERNVFNFSQNDIQNAVVQSQNVVNNDAALIETLKEQITFLKQENEKLWGLVNKAK
jgi:transcriptional regulator with XRE-family HTH domain